MQEHEYRARDKTVKKMSRDGLKEENLHSRKSIRVSNRETDDFSAQHRQRIWKIFQSGEKGRKIRSLRKRSCIRKSRQNRSCGNSRAGHGEKWKKRAASRKMRIPESESARWQEEIEEADSNTGERLSDYSSRVESIRGHPSGAREYAEAAAWTSHSRKNSRCSPMSEEKGQKKRQKKNRRLRKKKNLPVFVRTRKQRSSRWKGSVRKSRER